MTRKNKSSTDSGTTGPIAQYSPLARGFHWLTAVLFMLQFPVGYVLAMGPSAAASKFLLSAHMVTGIAIFWIVVIRAAYRLATASPRSTSVLAPWHGWASKAIHTALYILLLSVPVMGWLASHSVGGSAALGWMALPASITPDQSRAALVLYWHGLMAFVLLGAVFVHIAIAMQGFLEAPDSAAASEEDSGTVNGDQQIPALPAAR